MLLTSMTANASCVSTRITSASPTAPCCAALSSRLSSNCASRAGSPCTGTAVNCGALPGRSRNAAMPPWRRCAASSRSATRAATSSGSRASAMRPWRSRPSSRPWRSSCSMRPASSGMRPSRPWLSSTEATAARWRSSSAARVTTMRLRSARNWPMAATCVAVQGSARPCTVSRHSWNEPGGVNRGPSGPTTVALAGSWPQSMVSVCSQRSSTNAACARGW